MRENVRSLSQVLHIFGQTLLLVKDKTSKKMCVENSIETHIQALMMQLEYMYSCLPPTSPYQICQKDHKLLSSSRNCVSTFDNYVSISRPF